LVLDDYLEDGLRLLELEYPDTFQMVESAQERLATETTLRLGKLPDCIVVMQ